MACVRWRAPGALRAQSRTNLMMSSVEVPGPKIAWNPVFFSGSMSASGMMPPANSSTSSGVDLAVAQRLDDARKQLHVRAGEDAQADDVDVLLQRGLGDHLRRLADAGVDDLHAGVAQRARDDLGPAVVTVEAGLGDEDANLVVCHSEGIIWTFRRLWKRRMAFVSTCSFRP